MISIWFFPSTDYRKTPLSVNDPVNEKPYQPTGEPRAVLTNTVSTITKTMSVDSSQTLISSLISVQVFVSRPSLWTSVVTLEYTRQPSFGRSSARTFCTSTAPVRVVSLMQPLVPCQVKITLGITTQQIQSLPVPWMRTPPHSGGLVDINNSPHPAESYQGDS